MDLKPITRKEIFLQKIIDNTAMGGSSGGVTINNQDKTITENGTYTADEGFTGLGTVTVDVQSGGGGDEASVLDGLIERHIREIASNAELVGQYAFYGCSLLRTVNFPLAKTVVQYAFYGCRDLRTANLPLAKTVGQYAFYDCLLLTTVDFPLVTSIDNYAFYHCKYLTALILRSETMATLSNKNAFTSTPIASGTGYIYVPRALVDTYKSATNWSTYATQFRALEDYTVDGTISGELDESKI